MSCPSSITIIIKCMTCVDAYCGYFHNLSTLESSTFMVGCHKVHSHHNHDNRRIDDIMIVDATHIQLIHMEPSEIPSTNNSTVSPNALMHLLLFRATRDHRRVVCGRARARPTNNKQLNSEMLTRSSMPVHQLLTMWMRRLEEIQTNTMLDVGYDHQLECLEAQAAFCTGFQISSGAFEKIKKRYYGQCLIMNM